MGGLLVTLNTSKFEEEARLRADRSRTVRLSSRRSMGVLAPLKTDLIMSL